MSCSGIRDGRDGRARTTGNCVSISNSGSSSQNPPEGRCNPMLSAHSRFNATPSRASFNLRSRGGPSKAVE